MPESLAIRIAAGEVIERPASVVKELVENAIDAEATEIAVHISDGGRKLIKVIDNGTGMSADDAAAAFQRHATSKLMSEDDLWTIRTMGFRGEALPSIASVSETVLYTKMRGQTGGVTVRMRGGRLEDSGDAGCADGTTVEVRALFFNTPARLKFLRSVNTETGHIYDVIIRLALSFPAIRFRLFNNKEQMIDTAGRSDLRIRIAEIFGREFLKDMMEVHAENNEVRVNGFIAGPENTYSTSKGIFLYVNNRWIRDKGLNHAIINGYREVLANGRYPFVVLMVYVRPGDVDVNVHPAKSEVRFRNAKAVYEAVSGAVRDVLSSAHSSNARPYGEAAASEAGFTDRVKEAMNTYQKKVERDGVFSEDFRYARGAPDHQSADAAMPVEAKRLFFSEMTVIGQLWCEFILCERDDEFLIIDQHAAAERIAFERLKKDYYLNRRLPGQYLLIPHKIELSLQERDALAGSAERIKSFGFDIEPFGGATFIMRTVPDILSGMECSGLIRSLIEELSSEGMSSIIEDRIDEILMRIACHSVVRGKRFLSNDEIKALVERLAGVDFSGNCPHGRPVIKAMSRLEIEKMFMRR